MATGVYVRTEAHRKILSEIAKNKHVPCSDEKKEKLRKLAIERGAKYPSFAGRKHSVESRLKMSEKRQGQVVWNKGIPWSDEMKQKLSEAHLGITFSLSRRQKMGMMGEKHPNWKGGITKQNSNLRQRTDYKEWRRHVFQRDDYTCQGCGARGCYLQADHVMPFSFYPDLRTEILNGQTLCVKCHRKTATFANHKDIL